MRARKQSEHTNLCAHGAHVEVHEGRGECSAPEERRGLLFPLHLDAVQSGEQIGLALIEPAEFERGNPVT